MPTKPITTSSEYDAWLDTTPAGQYANKFGSLPEGLFKWAVDSGQAEGLDKGYAAALASGKALSDEDWNNYVLPPTMSFEERQMAASSISAASKPGG